ncbi:MAG: UPF0175 family protein [Ignavibacteriae bacterium]|nr:UPF0175 family protein [Ignavibacteriota bacterium]
MSISIPDDVLDSIQMSEAEIRLELAVALFAQERATLGQGGKIAGLSQLEFQRVLGSRRIPLHYSVEDFEADVQTLRRLTA